MGTIILIVLVIMLLGGGGWGYNRYGYAGGIGIGGPLLIVLILLLLMGFVHAAEVVTPVVAVPASSETQVWFGNALTGVLTLAVPYIAWLVGQLIQKAAAYFGIKASAEDQAKMDSELKVALTQGFAGATALIDDKGWDHVDVHSHVLASALNFFLQRNPERSTKIATAAGVANPAEPSPAKDAAVTQSLLARLPDAAASAAASPATAAVKPVMIEPGLPN